MRKYRLITGIFDCPHTPDYSNISQHLYYNENMEVRRNTFAWLDVPAEKAARRLLGCELLREIDGREVRVRIVETEAYDQADEASHTFKGRSKRNDAMFKGAWSYVCVFYVWHAPLLQCGLRQRRVWLGCINPRCRAA